MAINTVRYTVVNGEIIAEKREGVRRCYVPDPQGSTIALLDSSQTKTDTFTYWPFGEEKSRTGTTPTPFRYLGTLGYYRDTSERLYVRARHYQPNYGRWMTVDPLWPGEQAYQYTLNDPISYSDQDGRQVAGNCDKYGRVNPVKRIKCPSIIARERRRVCDILKKAGESGLAGAMSGGKPCLTGPKQAKCLIDWCNRANVYCVDASDPNCGGGVFAVCSFACPRKKQHPNWPIYICLPTALNPFSCPDIGCANGLTASILHEAIGVCGSIHQGGPPYFDACENRTACLCKAMPAL